eukprot:6675163-Prymnesium_polylepis.2
MAQIGVRWKEHCKDAVPPLAPTTTVLVVRGRGLVASVRATGFFPRVRHTVVFGRIYRRLSFIKDTQRDDEQESSFVRMQTSNDPGKHPKPCSCRRTSAPTL